MSVSRDRWLLTLASEIRTEISLPVIEGPSYLRGSGWVERCACQNGMNGRWGNEGIPPNLDDNAEEKRKWLTAGGWHANERWWGQYFKRFIDVLPCHSHLLFTQWIFPLTLRDFPLSQPTHLDENHILLWDRRSLWHQTDNGSKWLLLSSKIACWGVR